MNAKLKGGKERNGAVEETTLTAAEVLSQLLDANTTHEQERQTVLEAEATAFTPDQIESLKPLLRRFIERHRDSNDPGDLVAVGSAIRKYVGMLDRTELASLAFVLEAGHRVPVPPEIELEVAKMVVRKLTAVLPPEPSALAELENQLRDLARTYLNPRLLPRQHYGAIALHSVLALVLLPSAHQAELFDILKELRLSWFRQLVLRRAEVIDRDLQGRFADKECRPQRESLDQLIRLLHEEGSPLHARSALVATDG